MTIGLKKIGLIGFRGALDPIYLEFPNNGEGSIVLYGEGGSGKTTFTEAVEWFYYDRIEALEREFCGKESYFNLRLNQNKNATVSLEFNNNILNDIKTLPRVGTSIHSNSSSEFTAYLAFSLKENFILRHHDLQDFVDEKRKTDKLTYFAKLTGFEKVIETRKVLMQAFNALKDSPELATISGQLKEAQGFFVDNLKSQIINKDTVLDFAKQQLKSAKPDMSIENINELPEISKKLYDLADTSEIGKRKHVLSQLKEQLIISEGKWGSIPTELKNWIDEYKEYLKDVEAIQKESLARLYELGKKIITSKEWEEKDKCPLCGSSINGGELVEHLSSEIARIESSLEKKKALDRNYSLLDSNLSESINKLRIDAKTFNENKSEDDLIEKHKTKLVPEMDKLLSVYESTYAEISGAFKNLKELSLDYDAVTKLTEDIKSIYKDFNGSLKQEIESLKVKPEIQLYLDTAKLFENLHSQFLRSEELSSKIERINIQVDSLKAIQEAFEKREKKLFNEIIDVLSKDIDKFYRILNPGEGVEKIYLFSTDDKGAGRGMEIGYEFHGTDQYPARKYLSESHRNSLGISIFLASGKYFNKANKFLILDDIYTSLDVNHRERLINLFTHPSLADKQFLITTHDLVWFKFMQRALKSDPRWKFMEIRKWRIDSGIEIAEAPESIRKRIVDYLDHGESFAACKCIRSCYEETLKRIAKKLQIRVTYKEAANWTADEFYSGIGERVKGSSIATDTNFTAGNPIGFLANLAAHENDANVTSGTVKAMIDMIDDFDKAFFCDGCQKYLWHSRKASGGFQCQCGTIHC